MCATHKGAQGTKGKRRGERARERTGAQDTTNTKRKRKPGRGKKKLKTYPKMPLLDSSHLPLLLRAASCCMLVVLLFRPCFLAAVLPPLRRLHFLCRRRRHPFKISAPVHLHFGTSLQSRHPPLPLLILLSFVTRALPHPPLLFCPRL